MQDQDQYLIGLISLVHIGPYYASDLWYMWVPFPEVIVTDFIFSAPVGGAKPRKLAIPVDSKGNLYNRALPSSAVLHLSLLYSTVLVTFFC